jgi:DNA polymerase
MATLKSEEQLEYEAWLADQPGYEIVLTVHDEVICEAPDDPAFSHHVLSALMAQGEDWTEGLPLAAAGFEAKRYRKG